MEQDLGFLLCLEAVASGAAAVPAPRLPAVRPEGQMCWEGSGVHGRAAGMRCAGIGYFVHRYLTNSEAEVF